MNLWPYPEIAVDEAPGELPAAGEALRLWQESLDALQAEAETALQQAGNPVTPGTSATPAKSLAGWASPDDLGPLPESLLERARAVAALQQRVVAMLASSRDGVERELAEITRPRQQVSPVYVDVTG